MPSKQDDLGRWKLENAYNGRYQVDIEEKGKPSKWITLNALKVLMRLYSDQSMKTRLIAKSSVHSSTIE